ncbi:hypothetical protein Tco_1339490, partial [Tanacetum coccineum]
RTKSDNDKNPSFTLKDYEEEEETQKDDYMHTLEKEKTDDEEKVDEEENNDVAKELYEDMNINQGNKDAKMTNADQGGTSQLMAPHKSGYVHEEDAHLTLTTVHDKTEGPLQSSSISSDFTSKLLNLDNPSPYINSLMDTATIPAPPPPISPSPHYTTIT